ncbi:hypothetical protein H2199_000909 [Coniosporium tulheliwenetii]|uniref:Uncharacterized protein n=1 Tax=Coniosporium tulheliwenetii TaxID=3383036 RepID=A0ACC2ZN98_9PEZI|nr:hypothetical protein H2199_000909 [Cladosporium sp. JES 115]
MDGSTQYFLGGATKSTSCVVESDADSALWFGCETIGSVGGICEVAVCMKRPNAEGHPIYIVPNIEEVPHWKDVRGPFNFYAGVPITTPNGYNIGTLFAFSARPRPDLEPEEKLTMVRIAKQVMSHLELELRVLERSRLVDMNRCLAEFGATRKASPSPVGWLDQTRVAAIAWSDSWDRLYTGEFDLPYLASFCMTAIAMVLHEEAVVANKQKADFIGSISHELRSPLHGILASTELLRDTACDSTQQYLMASVQSCGRVLLDTIDHVLDFGKFTSIGNKFTTPRLQSLRPNAEQSKPGASRSEPTTDGQLLNRPVAIDLASLCEEVIDSVLLGRTYHDALAPINDFDPSSNTPRPNQIRPVISLDIAKRDWRFVSQPGAIQRIIMNLFGNALKYTPDGYITVKVEAEDLEAEHLKSRDSSADGEYSFPGTTIAKIKVIDSGRGMSEDFITSRLWTPFAQEDQTAQGTGLGLSITKRVVNILGGDIDLKSTLGVGTTFTVQLPLRQLATPDEGPQGNQNHTPDVLSDVSLREQLQGKVFIVYEPYSTSGSNERVAGIIHARESLLKYMQDWYGLTLMREPGTPVDLVIVDESMPWSHASPDTDIFLSDKPRIVLGANPTTKLGELEPGGNRETTVYVTKPVAPRKLGRALRHLLPHLLGTTKSRGATPVTSTSSHDEESDVRRKETSPVHKQLQAGEGPPQKDEAALASSNDSELASQKRIAALEAELERLRSLLHEMRPLTGNTSGQTPNGIHHSDGSEAAPQTDYESETPVTLGTASKTQNMALRPANDGLPRILLVDDNTINLRVLTMYLRKAGIPDSKTLSVSSGEDAVAQFVRASVQGPPFDIVLMDLSMPGMDGFDATREIRAYEDSGGAMHEKALVVALTGLVGERDRDRALEAGVDRYFIKPFSGKQVDELLGYWREIRRVDVPGRNGQSWSV